MGALAPHVPDPWDAAKAFQLQALVQAPAFWAAVRDLGGGDPAMGRSAVCSRWLPRGCPWPVPARRRPNATGPGAKLACSARDGRGGATGADWVVHDTLSARLHPRRAISALLRAVQALGAASWPKACRPGKWLRRRAGKDWVARWPVARKRGRPRSLACDLAGAPLVQADGLFIVPHADGTTAIGSTTERSFSHAGPIICLMR